MLQPPLPTRPVLPPFGYPPVEIESLLYNSIQSDESVGYMIYFHERPDLSAARELAWLNRGRYVVQRLQEAAARSQTGVRAYLDAQGARYEAFWIDNVIVVESSDLQTINGVLAHPGVSALRARRHPILYQPESVSAAAIIAGTESNIARVRADLSWALGFRGQGMVVGNIDTGVLYTHAALRTHYRGYLGGSYNHHYNWWDPYRSLIESPGDGHGHGTHVMGTMVGHDGGNNAIGMAPDATWIACRGCNTNNCTSSALLACAQFMLAPWDLAGQNPDPDRRPHVVNNSWGDCSQSYDGWYQGVVDSWVAAGIYPVFSTGNASNCSYSTPPPCGTVGNPARYGNVTGVGSTGTSNGLYASHSNRGPSDVADTINPLGYASIKPQVVAPGVMIRSAVSNGDTSYGYSTGTSMSAPHVAGLVALVWSAGPCLVGDYAATETLIMQTARPVTGGLPGACPGEGPGSQPNQSTGWGEIDALAAVQAAYELCSGGTLAGRITDAAAPATDLARVLVTVNKDGITRITHSNDTGHYSLRLSQGSHEVSFTRYGYLGATQSNVAIFENATTTLDVPLDPAPRHTVSGRITDGEAGWPLYARISIQGEPLSPPPDEDHIWSDRLTGEYALALPEGITHTLRVEAWAPGYTPVDIDLAPLQTGEIRDVTLEGGCAAPGRDTSAIIQSFDSGSLPTGWAVLDHAGSGAVWRFDHPDGRANLTGGEGGYAVAHSDAAGDVPVDTELRSPMLDMRGRSTVQLGFRHDFRSYSANEVADVDVSVDGGATWTNVWRHTGSDQRGPAHVSLDVSALAAGHSAVMTRFNYYGARNDWWWQIDDVWLGSPECPLQPGGLVVGTVYDANTGSAVLGAGLSDGHGHHATTAATDDPALDGALYVLFAPPGSQSVTASGLGYGPASAQVAVPDGGAVAQDFVLAAGRLHVEPTTLSAELTSGSTVTLPLTLTNNGDLAVTYQLSARSLSFEASQTLSGARVQVPAGATIADTARGGSARRDPDREAYDFILGDVRLAASTVRVLVLTPDVSGGNVGLLLTTLAAFPDLDVSLWDAETYGEPSVADLLAHDVVIVGNDLLWASMSKTVVGDRLADYIDAGGRVIEGLYLQSFDEWGFAGRYMADGYSPFTPASGDHFVSGSMVIVEPLHAVMSGVSAVTDTWGHQNPGLRDCATLLARWSGTNAPYIAVNNEVVALNQLIHHDAEWTGDVGIILHNAAVWLAQSSVPPWLNMVPATGTLFPGDSVIVNVRLDPAAGNAGRAGIHRAQIQVHTDTPYAQVIVPIEMTVRLHTWMRLPMVFKQH
jgi:subtilisin family serine protease